MPRFLPKLFNKSSETPEGRLIAAAEAGKLWRVRRLLKAGVDVNGKNRGCRTALSVAASKGQEKVVTALLKAGANTEAGHDIMGRTALGLAAEAGHTGVVRQLVAAGADIDAATSNGMTVLHYAIFYQHRDIAHMLVDAGARLSTLNSSNQSPLHYAVNFCADVAISMVQKGADLAPRDSDGLTALELAQQCGIDDVVAAISARLEREAAARAEREKETARDAAAKEAAIASAGTLQRPIAVGKPLAFKK